MCVYYGLETCVCVDVQVQVQVQVRQMDAVCT